MRRSAEIFAAGDLDRYIDECVAADIVWCTAAEDPDAGTHEGHEAFKRYLEQWMDSFDGLHAEVEEWIELDDGRVFGWARWTGRGRTSGLDADWHLAIIYTLRDGKISRGEEYFDRGEALRAAALAE
jgi:ketosteroid isomerase-like protein